MNERPSLASELLPNPKEGEVTKKYAVTEVGPKPGSDLIELPKELGGGYVRRSALEAYEGWEQLAQEANEGRSVFKKVFLIDKKSAMDFAREEADKEEKERAKENEKKLKLNEEKETLTRALSDSFDAIFFDAGDSPYLEGFQKLVFEGHIDTIFSEDKSGRIPALICKKFLNAIYTEEGKDKTRAFSMPIGKLGSYDYNKRYQEDVDFVASKISELADKNILGTNILYVTDFVSGGGTVKRFSGGVEKMMADKRGIPVPVRSILDDSEKVAIDSKSKFLEFYSLITNGISSYPPRKGQFYMPHPQKMPIFDNIRSGGLEDVYDNLYDNFSGISRQKNSISRKYLSKERMEARREVIDEVTKHLLERWRKWKIAVFNKTITDSREG